MDKPTENNVILDYNRGWRAYDIHGTTQKFLQNSNTGTYWLLSDVYHSYWHALRAYQDEQRKKGVPIKIGQLGDSWLRRDFSIDNRYYLFNYVHGGDVHISFYNDSRIGVAVFTNFRWREGYPKKGIGGIVTRIEDAQL